MSVSNRTLGVAAIAAMRAQAGLSAEPVSMDSYAEDVFNAETMRRYLPQAVAEKLLGTIQDGMPLDAEIAADVAHAMKTWALERGATHFTHWFLPLTGSTAEKHDSFLDILPEGQPTMSFSAKNLIVGEPDASSFPSGGLRCTFEARGYTAWDPTSPAFIKRHGNGATLCIPTAFCSYTGEALDKKTPLLRSIQALTTAIKRLMKCFGLPDERVRITLGVEQEYFLIDKHFYLQRPDLVQTGRTLFGAPPSKQQQLDDHYYGSIKNRVLNFMTDVEKELWRLGIPARTRHNEVAPAQFELAPMFEEANLAIDHNMLVMEVLRQVADRHGLVCLLHEKPFTGVNGSGKHNNWSLAYGQLNLLNPGHDPHQNAIFLTVLAAIIQAVDRHGDLLRAAVASAGNDHRLGANEAPPSIISIYLGDQLSEVIEQLVENGTAKSCRRAGAMRIGVDTLPPLPRDATDRNRTSPFAFTGQKFEFRAPGSSQCCSDPVVTLNTIVAESIEEFAVELENVKKADFNIGLQKLLKKTIKAHKRIVFNGDNYSAQWRKEAAKRGLPNATSTMQSLQALNVPANIALFQKFGVYCIEEMQSRYDVFMEEYHRKIRIEGGIALEIARSMIIPVVRNEYIATLPIRNHHTSKTLRRHFDQLIEKTDALAKALTGLHEEILAALNELRQIVDTLEPLIQDSHWPLPKYREMLFVY